MPTLTRSIIVSLVGFAVGLAGLPAGHAAPRASHVFIVSIDQGNPDLIQKTAMPALEAMVAGGARTWNAYTIIPPITLPSHTSMLTGVGPQVHQVLWNDYQTNKGPVKVPTIFSLAKQRGLTTAMYVGKEKFKHLELPGSLDSFVWSTTNDSALAVAGDFARQVSRLKPNLCFIHFRDPDTAGHAYGSTSPEKVQALVDCDAALKIIKDAIAAAGIAADSVIIVSADHGSHDTRNRQGKTVAVHDSPIPEDVTIPWIAWGKGVKTNFVITAPVVQYDTAATALWLLDVPLPESFWGRPVVSAFE